MSFKKNKKGVNLIYSTVIFIILNIVFFAAVFAFVARSGSGGGLNEQILAKEIALLVDGSKPGTTIFINLKEAQPFLKDSKLTSSDAFQIRDGEIIVKLTQDLKGYSFPYFSDYKIESAFGNNDNGNLILVLNVGDKND